MVFYVSGGANASIGSGANISASGTSTSYGVYATGCGTVAYVRAGSLFANGTGGCSAVFYANNDAIIYVYKSGVSANFTSYQNASGRQVIFVNAVLLSKNTQRIAYGVGASNNTIGGVLNSYEIGIVRNGSNDGGHVGQDIGLYVDNTTVTYVSSIIWGRMMLTVFMRIAVRVLLWQAIQASLLTVPAIMVFMRTTPLTRSIVV